MTPCLLKNEPVSVIYMFSLTPLSGGGTAKASLNRTNLYVSYDPKPGELTLSRLNPAERREEDRTRQGFNPVR